MKKLVAIFISIFVFLSTANMAFASDAELYSSEADLVSSEASLPYSAAIVSPPNQIDTAKEYFDLLVVPGAQHEVSVEVKNSSDKPITLNIVPQNGTTSPTGSLDYTGSGVLLEATMPYLFTDVCSPAQQITLAAHEQVWATFALTLPDVPFEGVLLGAFQIYEQMDEPSKLAAADSEDVVEIRNRFMFIIGAVLQMDTFTPAPEFFLEQVSPNTWNDRFALNAKLHQSSPTIVKNYVMSGEVISHASGKTIHDFTWNNLSMAPNSVLEFSEVIDPDLLPAGIYTLKLSVMGEDREWHLEEDFEVTAFQKYRVISNSIDASNLVVNTVLLCVLLTLVVVLGIWFAQRTIRKRYRK